MKIVSWNCNGALRKKLEAADSLKADVLIVQECENPALSTKAYRDWAGDYLWAGNNKNRGIGVFPKNNNSVQALNWSGTFEISGLKTNSLSKQWSTNDLQLFLPFKLNHNFNILACWTKGSESQIFGYMGQFWKYIQIHREELKQNNTIILGDFNSNAAWDKPDRWWSHTDTINELSSINIESLYHYQNNEMQGHETQPTFFLHRNKSKPYHIDYVFMAKPILSKSHLKIGSADNWLNTSDHVPLCVTISS